mmetsp:Transcript_99608/g.321141  ORF Transcript_99608/g.321141 Transcript_99608/m.321141 type:complete len:228 (-) Transcript_99608:998-1681(-)
MLDLALAADEVPPTQRLDVHAQGPVAAGPVHSAGVEGRHDLLPRRGLLEGAHHRDHEATHSADGAVPLGHGAGLELHGRVDGEEPRQHVKLWQRAGAPAAAELLHSAIPPQMELIEGRAHLDLQRRGQVTHLDRALPDGRCHALQLCRLRLEANEDPAQLDGAAHHIAELDARLDDVLGPRDCHDKAAGRVEHVRPELRLAADPQVVDDSRLLRREGSLILDEPHEC